MNLFALAAVVLLVLKLCGVVAIGWLTIAALFFAPLLILGALLLVALLVGGSAAGLLGLFTLARRRR